MLKLLWEIFKEDIKSDPVTNLVIPIVVSILVTLVLYSFILNFPVETGRKCFPISPVNAGRTRSNEYRDLIHSLFGCGLILHMMSVNTSLRNRTILSNSVIIITSNELYQN